MSAHGENRFLTGAGSARAATEIAKSLYKIPTLLTTWVRCGKPRCRCREGHLHGPYFALHWRDGALQRRCYVRRADVPAVCAILDQRREQQRHDRLFHALSLKSWRQLAQLAEDFAARLRDEREQL